jgi:hypothetical protein
MLILIRYSGEVSTKAPRARARLGRYMETNIADAFQAEGIDFQLRREWSRIFVETDHPRALELVGRIFGVQSYSVVQSEAVTDLEGIIERGAALYRDSVRGHRFAVRARVGREGAPFRFRSIDVERQLGTALLPAAHKVERRPDGRRALGGRDRGGLTQRRVERSGRPAGEHRDGVAEPDEPAAAELRRGDRTRHPLRRGNELAQRARIREELSLILT